MSFKKIVLTIGLGAVVLVALSVGLFQREMSKLNENPTKYYREGLLDEIRHLELYSAAYHGDRESLLRLIQSGQNIHLRRTSFRFTPFHVAIFNGQIETADLLLSKGAKIDEKSNYNQTALHWAAMMGQEGAVRFLLERGASLEDSSEQGWTAVHIASRMGYINIVKILVEKGARKDRKTPEGQTAEDIAKSFNQQEVARYLGSIP